jgi:ribosomal protein L7/L12
MNPPEESDKLEAIKAALYQGRKIEAIKLLREHTGKGLAESKEAVEKLEQELRAKTPDKFTASKSGCFGVMVAFVAAVAILGVWFAMR